MNLDLLVVGSGVAGLSAVVRAAQPGLRVGVISKGELSDSATQWAQGGVAAVLHHSEAEAYDDDVALHAADTLRAGAGLCDRDAVEVLVREGPARVRELAALGAAFDRSETGRWKLSREAGHSRARVVHAGGAATGAEVERTLVEAARLSAAQIWEHTFAADLILEGGRCRGVTIVDDSGASHHLRATHVLLATGGSGQLYTVTTNPAGATADGVAMALRASVPVADLEFVQFHPTALHVPGATGPRPLLSEALRGDGALLRDLAGHRFVDELQPRDVVASAVAARIRESGGEHVWLDLSPVADFERRFPTLAGSARRLGLDPARDWLPVAPAAHYHCGGILTDLDGATALPGLWAAGETACTGVHGANRLASNSLLEGMVFAARSVEAMIRAKEQPDATGALGALLEPGARRQGTVAVQVGEAVVPPSLRGAPAAADATKLRDALQRVMTDGAGVVRSAATIRAARHETDALAAGGLPAGEVANLADVAAAVLVAAEARTESRGGHRRSDHPGTDPALSRRFVL